jgi:hypothetical protein
MTTNPSTAAAHVSAILAALTGYAKSDAKPWTKGDTTRIYFGRDFLAITDGGIDYTASKGNPYGVIGTCEQAGVPIINKPSYR